jgi:hypothetical protein
MTNDSSFVVWLLRRHGRRGTQTLCTKEMNEDDKQRHKSSFVIWLPKSSTTMNDDIFIIIRLWECIWECVWGEGCCGGSGGKKDDDDE